MGRILVVEDHALVREGLVAAVKRLEGVVEVLEAADAASARAMLAQASDVELVLLDLMVPGARGFVLLNSLRCDYPSIPVVVVSARDDRHTISRSLQLGASGFVPKSHSGEQLLDALRIVLEGGVYVPPTAPPVMPPARGRRAAEAGGRQVTLTAAQSRVLALLAQGRTNREIGDALGLAEGTVKIHLTAIYKALGVSNRAQALLVLADPDRLSDSLRPFSDERRSSKAPGRPPDLEEG